MLLDKLKTDKSAGPDNISPRLLKETATELSKGLAILFQRSIQEGKLPTPWKDATVSPVFKKGAKSDPGNYRPISLTSVVGKLLERLIRQCLMDHLKQHNLLSDSQFGFRNGRSCQLQLLHVLDSWTEDLDQGLNVDILFFDYSKAFDTVPHKKLVTKLKAYGITGNLLSWISDFLTNRRQCVVINGSHSNWVPVKSGVPQGSVLGPILFLLFVNDLPSVTTNPLWLFADDTKASLSFTQEEECQTLQDDINNMAAWTDKWQLSFNAKKCKAMYLGPKNPHHQYYMADSTGLQTEIVSTTEEKDLGVTLDPKLTFKAHIAKITKKANSITGHIARNLKHLDASTFTTLYKALI